MRRRIQVWVLAAALAVAISPGAASAKAHFKGNVCSLVSAGELAAAHIPGPACTKGKPIIKAAKPTPLGGTYGASEWGAHWGVHEGGSPIHYLVVTVFKIYGSGASLAKAHARLRHQVLAYGHPIGVGKPGAFFGESATCSNPPTDDCTNDSVKALVGSYEVFVLLEDAQPGPAGAETPPGDDTAQDQEEQESDRGPVIAIAKSIAAAL